MSEKLGLTRDQYTFLKSHDQVDQFEKLFDRSNVAVYPVDGDASAVTTTIGPMNVGESMEVVYTASGGARTINLPAIGTFNVLAVVTVNNTFTTSPSVKVGRGVAGVLVSSMASGASIYAKLTRVS